MGSGGPFQGLLEASQQIQGLSPQGGGIGDFVLDLRPDPPMHPEERDLLLEEARRQGLGTEYNTEAWPTHVRLTVGARANGPDMSAVRAALLLLLALGLEAGQLRYSFFPHPHRVDGREDLFSGPLQDFVAGVAS